MSVVAATLQSHILLKNENNVLPLDTKKRTFLVGPMSGGYQVRLNPI